MKITSIKAYRVDHVFVEPRLEPDPLMGEPFVVRGPEACRDEDRELGKMRRQRRVEAHELAELLGPLRQFRAREPRHQRRRRRAALAGDRVFHHAQLRVAHLGAS